MRIVENAPVKFAVKYIQSRLNHQTVNILIFTVFYSIVFATNCIYLTRTYFNLSFLSMQDMMKLYFYGGCRGFQSILTSPPPPTPSHHRDLTGGILTSYFKILDSPPPVKLGNFLPYLISTYALVTNSRENRERRSNKNYTVNTSVVSIVLMYFT